jgi:hypothetical protein
MGNAYPGSGGRCAVRKHRLSLRRYSPAVLRLISLQPLNSPFGFGHQRLRSLDVAKNANGAYRSRPIRLSLPPDVGLSSIAFHEQPVLVMPRGLATGFPCYPPL